MSAFGRRTYGQPCRECAFSWDSSVEDAEVLIASLPTTFAALLKGHDGSERFENAPWSATSYIYHVADNLKIWAERLADIGLDGTGNVVAYDQDALAKSRGYDSLPLRAALWTLDRATADWRAARSLAASKFGAVLHHPEMGDQSLDEVVLQVAHDAAHHVFDVRRAIEARSS